MEKVVLATVAGMRVRVRGKVVSVQTPWGILEVLRLERDLPIAEMQRISEELGMPVEAGGTRVFPRGKSAKDMVKKG